MKDWARENPWLVFIIILATLGCVESVASSLAGHKDEPSTIRVGCGS